MEPQAEAALMESPIPSPRLVVAHPSRPFLAQLCRRLASMGWQVHVADSGTHLRQLAHRFAPSIVVLDADLADESGWLTCAKLRRERPRQRVILVSVDPTAERRRLASFVGGDGLVSQSEEVLAMIDAVCDTPEMAQV
ncbi:MAG: response regulator [Gemmataceae bacterium]|nr:response regulator [Gemmataceae bacterium]